MSLSSDENIRIEFFLLSQDEKCITSSDFSNRGIIFNQHTVELGYNEKLRPNMFVITGLINAVMLVTEFHCSPILKNLLSVTCT